jgi:hypothetical protein
MKFVSDCLTGKDNLTYESSHFTHGEKELVTSFVIRFHIGSKPDRYAS